MTVTERFAPSPTGRLHLGHALSAMLGHDAARAAGGRFLLRVEDLDTGRSRPEFEAALLDDLRWLDLRWDEAPVRQSARGPLYGAALDRLAARGLLYPCACTRREIALAAPQEGAEGPVYPGTCRGRPMAAAGEGPHALRLDLDRALAALGRDPAVLGWTEIDGGGLVAPGPHRLDPQALRAMGDPALARKDAGVAYHLAVVVDDAAQGVTHVTRGADLAASTPLHRLLQALLGLPTPLYRHHRLIRDAAGRRLAKRDDARSLAALRAEGATPEDIRRMVGL
jgi:glutamyl-Q tRNA(Asp) synthetase